MPKKNVGEWSEYLAFLELLRTRTLRAIRGGEYIDIEKIKKVCRFKKASPRSEDGVSLEEIEACLLGLTDNELENAQQELLSALTSHEKGTFNIPTVEKFAKKRLKSDTKSAPSITKSDLKIELENGDVHPLSVKSWMGALPTIVNASKLSTRVTLKAKVKEGFKPLHTESSKVSETLYHLVRSGATLESITLSETSYLQQNLNSLHPQGAVIFAHMLIAYYCGRGANTIELPDEETLDLQKVHSSSINNLLKTRNFLAESFSKELPSLEEIELFLSKFIPFCLANSLTKKEDETNFVDNCLAVLKEGDIIAFMGQDSLVSNFSSLICFDTPSTSRHAFGELTPTNDPLVYEMHLNFQLRANQPKSHSNSN